MILLGLDLAIDTGWAMGARDQVPVAGLWHLEGFDVQHQARSMASIERSVRAMVSANKVEGVAIESPLSLGGRSAHTERSLTMLSGAAQAGAITGGAKWVKLVAPQTWRKAVLGDGFPDKPKEASVYYCSRLRGWPITDHNVADAACILEYAHGVLRREQLL